MKKFLFLSLMILSASIYAQKIPFQGRLLEDGKPFNGTSTIEFSIANPTWSETKSNVNVQDGYYSVVLGETTPLPDTLFSTSPEVQLNITVNGEVLSPVTLYSSLLPYAGPNGGTIQPDSIESRSVRVLGADGSIKADLNFFETNNAGSLVLNGANDSTKVILGSASGGYGGFLGLYDSLRNIGAQLRVTNKGVGNLFTRNEAHLNAGWFGGLNNDGFVQLISYDETETFTGAALIGSFVDGNLPEYYLEGSAQENFGLGRFRVTPLGNSAEETAIIEINRSNGGGQAIMTIAQDDGGSDPTGSNGQIDLFGDESVNIQIGSQGFEDHDLPVINMYGSIDDGGGWWYNTAQMNAAKTGDGTQEFGNVVLYNNSAGNNMQSANITGNLNETGAGGLELFDNLNQLRSSIEGNVGRINAFGPNGSFNVSLRGRGDSDFGYVEMFNANSERRAEIGSFGDNSGFMILYGDNGNKNIQIDRNPGNTNLGQVNVFGTDGITAQVFASAETDGVSEWGFLSLEGSSGGIQLDGNLGNISASGNVSANTLSSSDGTVQSSDRRLKKDISALTNALEKTLQMRGVSYTWKDETKSQRNQIGVIAQEVEEIYPEFVHTDEKGMKAVNYAQMSAVLIEAIKALNAKVEKLENENTSLKASLAEVETLRKDMDRLMKMLGTSKAAGK